MKHTLLFLLLSANVAFGQNYCANPFTLGGFGAITNVSLGVLNNTTGLQGSNGYLDTTLPKPVLYRDSTYVLSVTFDTVAPATWPIDNTWYAIGLPFDTVLGYLQFNTLNRFYRSGSPTTTNAPVTDTFQITVPHNATLGTHRLRVVRWGKTSGGITPRLCTDVPITYGSYGESEDYNVLIADIPPVVGVNVPREQKHAIYPNPTTGIIHIEPATEAAIYNLVGQLVYSGTGTEINISHLPSGIYLLKTNSEMFRIQKQ